MNYVNFNVTENKEVKLRLSARLTVQLERAIGGSPMNMFMGVDDGVLPKLEVIIATLHASLQALEHGYTVDKTYDLYEEYVDNGGSMIELIPTIIEVFQVSGILPKDKKEDKEEELEPLSLVKN